MFKKIARLFGSSPAAAPDARARGNAALAQGHLDAAAGAYRAAIALDANDRLAHVSLGYVLLEQGRAADAQDILARAVTLAASDPDTLADAHFLLARACGELGRPAAMAASLQAALDARPGFAEALQALLPAAQAVYADGQPQDALAALDRLLQADPANALARENRAALLLELGRASEALDDLEHVVAAHGASPDRLSNMAAALLKLDRPEDAIRCTERALAAQPDLLAALHNHGRALLELLRVDEAREHTRQALVRHPGDADLLWNLGVADLLLGDLAAGFEAHEARWRAKGFGNALAPDIAARPRWTGREPLAGRTLLVHAEQGLGDSIQFVRYLPRLAAQARAVVLRVPSPLAPLFEGLAAGCEVVAHGAPLPAFDAHCPLLSLPHAFGTTLSAVPGEVPYLRAEPRQVDEWRARLPGDRRPLVGIAWSGNPAHANDRNRSIPLADIARALADVDATFVSLLPQVREGDRAALKAWPGLVDAGPSLRDFTDTAALVSALDLVVTVDTSLAHLAGALGRPVWILLPYCPDWRWMLARADSPWYPTARLFRQPERHAWAPVLQQVRAGLAAWAGPQ